MTEKKGFDSRFMEELKQKNNLVEVASSYISLDRKGNNHWACCPFHHERTPSFSINEAEQFYHCFGCGESGDVVKFVKEMESTDFMGAIRILATRAKMEVPETNYDSEQAVQLKKKRDAITAILLDSAKFYLHNLYSGDKRADVHLQYLSRRGLSPTVIKKFGIGASFDFDGLPRYLYSKGYSQEDMLDSGVVSRSQKGKIFDAQAGRLIFPLINAMDEVIGFGGRVLEKTDFGKYKNTQDTLVFNKRKTLYNVNLLKKLKREQTIKEVIVVEGYMDTISLYQAGFKNVVASMGTAFTKEQAKLIKRYSDNVLISFDGDFAGQKADLRSIEILKEEGLNVKVVPLPDGLDPDDVVRKGAEAYQACLDAAMPLIDYKLHAIERKYDLSKKDEKRTFLAEALAVVNSAENESVKEELLKRLREKTGISYHSLEKDMRALGRTETPKQEIPSQKITEVKSSGDKTEKAERFILAAKLFMAPCATTFDVGTVTFSEPVHQLIAQYIQERESKGERIRPSELFEVLDENCPQFNAILDVNYGDKLEDSVAPKFFEDSVNVLKLENLNQKINALCARQNEEKDEDRRKSIGREIAHLINERNRLKK